MIAVDIYESGRFVTKGFAISFADGLIGSGCRLKDLGVGLTTMSSAL
jgi:hypothetical protein